MRHQSRHRAFAYNTRHAGPSHARAAVSTLQPPALHRYVCAPSNQRASSPGYCNPSCGRNRTSSVRAITPHMSTWLSILYKLLHSSIPCKAITISPAMRPARRQLLTEMDLSVLKRCLQADTRRFGVSRASWNSCRFLHRRHAFLQPKAMHNVSSCLQHLSKSFRGTHLHTNVLHRPQTA